MTALREFTRPLPLSAAALLALNDHLLKGAGILPAWLTGKLSDVAGLFFFPILLFALVGVVRPAPSSDRVKRALALALVTGIVFSAVKLVPAVNAALASALGPMVMDPTDLLALPMLVLGVLYLRAPPRAAPCEPRRLGAGVGSAAGVVFAALASLATSAPMIPRTYPAWTVAGPATIVAECAEVTPFVVKSGKEGFGITVTLRAPPPCEARLVAALVRIGAASSRGEIIQGVHDATFETVRTYVAFPFDNNALWNEGQRHGSLELELEGTPGHMGSQRVAFDLREVWEARHPVVPGGSRTPPPAPNAPDAAPPSSPPGSQ